MILAVGIPTNNLYSLFPTDNFLCPSIYPACIISEYFFGFRQPVLYHVYLQIFVLHPLHFQKSSYATFFIHFHVLFATFFFYYVSHSKKRETSLPLFPLLLYFCEIRFLQHILHIFDNLLFCKMILFQHF